jgi:hypothetical protein
MKTLEFGVDLKWEVHRIGLVERLTILYCFDSEFNRTFVNKKPGDK